MAKTNYKEVDTFIAQAKGEIDAKSPELAEARQTMKDLSAKYIETKDKGIRTELAEISTTVTNEIVRNQTNYIDLFADVARTGVGVKQQFEIERDLTSAEFTAKGVAGDRGTVAKEYVGIDTTHVTTRPYISFLDLASGRINFDRVSAKSAEKLNQKIVSYLESTMFDAFSTLSTPNYGSATGIDVTILKAQINAFGRFGQVSLVGDIEGISKITSIDGFASKLPEQLAIEQNQNGFIGTYNTANVIKLTNPFLSGSLTNTALRRDLLYILSSGDAAQRSLKVQFEGDVYMREHEDFETGDYEMMQGQIFGAKVVGAELYQGIYRIQ